ncbi:Uncharacterized protein PECH_000582 [Penicillium ucsense]|uniref:Exonuclease domain-containing protein n=1 Tax=Penicillium ucsense TaxID=2839758 RepID=A0A8J8W0I6_9EURO|nr:Uncharacterized protein PECM_000593 [Penicillium ucsense]KAF7733426.1 Uncharacterized protein PECH_000582 [Penicillium ucsense]
MSASKMCFQEEAPIQDSNDSAEPSHVSPPHDDIICAPLATDEYNSLLQSLRNACHSTNRLIVWGIKTQKDAGPAKKTPEGSQNTMNTAVPHPENDFRLTPPSQYRKTWYGSKVKSGLVSRVREAIVLDCEMVMCGTRQEIGFLSVIDFVTGEVLINCRPAA